jgi:hypothetical protein
MFQHVGVDNVGVVVVVDVGAVDDVDVGVGTVYAVVSGVVDEGGFDVGAHVIRFYILSK